jgi:hypothetical protein
MVDVLVFLIEACWEKWIGPVARLKGVVVLVI